MSRHKRHVTAQEWLVVTRAPYLNYSKRFASFNEAAAYAWNLTGVQIEDLPGEMRYGVFGGGELKVYREDIS